MSDLVGRIDQAEKTAEDTARIIAGFYRGLKSKEVDEATAAELTLLYTKKILGVK